MRLLISAFFMWIVMWILYLVFFLNYYDINISLGYIYLCFILSFFIIMYPAKLNDDPSDKYIKIKWIEFISIVILFAIQCALVIYLSTTYNYDIYVTLIVFNCIANTVTLCSYIYSIYVFCWQKINIDTLIDPENLV